MKKIWLFIATLLFIWVVNTFIPDGIYLFEHKALTYPVWLGVSVYVYWLIFRGLIQFKLSQDKSEIHDLLSIPKNQNAHLIVDKNSQNPSETKNVHCQNLNEQAIAQAHSRKSLNLNYFVHNPKIFYSVFIS